MNLGSSLILMNSALRLTFRRLVTDYLDEKAVQSLKQIHQQVCVVHLNPPLPGQDLLLWACCIDQDMMALWALYTSITLMRVYLELVTGIDSSSGARIHLVGWALQGRSQGCIYASHVWALTGVPSWGLGMSPLFGPGSPSEVLGTHRTKAFAPVALISTVLKFNTEFCTFGGMYIFSWEFEILKTFYDIKEKAIYFLRN